MKIALYTYNTKPRGGVIHTLALAEELEKYGCNVTVYALGLGGAQQFYRPVKAGTQVFPYLSRPGESFESRIASYIETYTEGLASEELEQYDIHHVQDCISANCLNRLMERGRVPFFLRTVHHLDDFTTPALVSCQQKSVTAPEQLITVSEYWRYRLRIEHGRAAEVIHNGVENRYFEPRGSKAELKDKYSLSGKTVFLTIGGIEPRKNTIRTLRAFEIVQRSIPDAVLVIAGGATLFDYRYYYDDFMNEWNGMDNEVRTAVRIVGAPSDAVIQDYYQLADCYLQPSIKEGWGLAIMEAMAGGTPVVASTIEVFREFLSHEHNALLADPEDERSIAHGMLRVASDMALRDRLSTEGKKTAYKYHWSATAQKHVTLYRRLMLSGRIDGTG
ncbi:MSMEG_0565 family glycosyltransferase [Paenibacillus sp. sgz302251]|uniref:MSMEG_0565 family glycosyltransferase n=1 Tax=Paenibacillus sp. sgz302251 TaxID=3414493 RepID=UPI003C7EDA12